MSRRLSIATLALVLAAYATALVWFTVHGRIDLDGRRFYVLGDDAMISMRYAYNLAHGRGFVWNPGEYVQGYTNLGWTLVMAGIHAAGAPLPIAPLVVKLVNVGLHLAMIALVLARLPLFPGVVTATLIAFDSALLVWGLNGFEVTLEALLILLACWSLLDERWPDRWAPVWAALAYVVRPDALLVLAWVVLWQRRPRARAPLLVAGALVAAVLVFQRAYYGDWLPNTFHLKASADIDRGLGYLERFALWEHFSLPLLFGPVLLWRLRITGLVLAWTAYIVVIGGDAFVYGRFFAAIMPLAAASCGLVLDRLVFTQTRLAAAGVVIFLAGLFVHVWLAAPLVKWAPMPVPESRRSVCLAIQGERGLPREARVGVYFAGTLPYFLPEHRFHDFLGKSDRQIAHGKARPGPPGHNKWDYAYSLGQVRPDVIVTAAPFVGLTDLEAITQLSQDYAFHPALWLHPIFRAEYRPVEVRCGAVVYARTR